MRVPRPHEAVDGVAVARHRELELLQVGRRLEFAHPQGVVHDLAREASEVFALGRRPRPQQLGEGVLARELVPVTVVLDPYGAHHGSDPGRKNDNGERGGEGRREKDSAWSCGGPTCTARYISLLPSH